MCPSNCMFKYNSKYCRNCRFSKSKPREYCVFEYQYNDMPKPRVTSVSVGERTHEQVLDTLPPTVIELKWITARTKQEAIKTFWTLRKTDDRSLAGWSRVILTDRRGELK